MSESDAKAYYAALSGALLCGWKRRCVSSPIVSAESLTSNRFGAKRRNQFCRLAGWEGGEGGRCGRVECVQFPATGYLWRVHRFPKDRLADSRRYAFMDSVVCFFFFARFRVMQRDACLVRFVKRTIHKLVAMATLRNWNSNRFCFGGIESTKDGFWVLSFIIIGNNAGVPIWFWAFWSTKVDIF